MNRSLKVSQKNASQYQRMLAWFLRIPAKKGAPPPPILFRVKLKAAKAKEKEEEE